MDDVRKTAIVDKLVYYSKNSSSVFEEMYWLFDLLPVDVQESVGKYIEEEL